MPECNEQIKRSKKRPISFPTEHSKSYTKVPMYVHSEFFFPSDRFYAAHKRQYTRIMGLQNSEMFGRVAYRRI